jgi:5'-nucleotidase / UDP-sugar diphosphatase
MAMDLKKLLAPLALAVAFIVAGCTYGSPTPDLQGQDVHLTIVHTADLHSRFYPYYFAPGQIDKGLGLNPKPGGDTAVVGGIARVGTVVKCIRGFLSGAICGGLTEVGPNGEQPIAGPPAARSLHLDSGDIWEGAPVFNQFNGEVEMRAMSNLGLSAMALGNHEFDKGSVNLEEQYQAWGGFPILVSNYIFSDPTDPTQPKLDDILHPYVIENVGGIKIGIIGMGNLSSLEGILSGGNSLGVRPLDAAEALTEVVETLRTQVDLIMVVSHLGLDEDEGVAASAAESSDQNLALGPALNQVDVIFGGHLHIVLNPPKDLPHYDDSGSLIGHTVLCHSGAFAKYVGRLDLDVHVPSADEVAAGQTRTVVKAYTYKLVPIDDSIPMDPELANLIEPYQLKMNQYLNLNQVYAVVGCPANSGTCPKTTRSDPNGGDSQLGNLVATSMRLREGVEADFGLTNSLGIRADFESGPLNLEEMYNVFPFDNSITTVFLSGQEVQLMLDGVASRSASRGCRTQSQVSGIYFDMVCNTDDSDCNTRQDANGLPHDACAKNIYLGDSCRQADGTFNGTKCTPLDPFGEYRVAVNDYIANGGSGFDVLKRNTTKFNTGISLRDALVDYIRTLTVRCDTTDYTNIVGVACKDSQGETFDCTATCCCHSSDPNADQQACGTDCDAYQLCTAGVICKDMNGMSYDCTKQCCAHDQSSGINGCSLNAPEFTACMQAGLHPSSQFLSPTPFDYRNTACLDQNVEAHDGRIETVGGGGGSMSSQ